MSTFPDLNTKRVVITGGGSGLGLEIARGFATEGANVHLIDLDADMLSDAVDELKAMGVHASFSVASVSDPGGIERAFFDVDATLGGLDILVNNAGISGNCPALDLDEDAWCNIVEVNLSGMFRCAREAGRRMCEQRGGVILNMSSIYGVVAAPERLGYCVTKAGVSQMTRSLSLEWASHGIRVNALAPGYVHTAIVDDLLTRGTYSLDMIEKRTPMGRLGSPGEIADAALFLASNRASYITGHVLCVDGGWTAYGYF